MPLLLKALLSFCLVSSSLARSETLHGRGYEYGGGPQSEGNDVNDADSSSSSTPASTAASSTPSGASFSNSALIGMKGDVVCTDYLCVGALVNGSTVQYTLQSLGKSEMGWMAMGFGQTMANSPMVIMWPNSDGTITLSQRKTSAEVMPTVDPSPPRPATLETSLSSLTGSNPKLVYTIPANSDTAQGIIWAFGNVNPDDKAVDATLVQHLLSGPTRLNLGNTLSASSFDPTNPISTLSGSSSGSGSAPTPAAPTIPLLPFQKVLVAHAIMCVIGFLFLLPAGALLARYLRTFSNTWFKGHWIFQLALAGPVIITGVALGITGVHKAGAAHLDDDHKRWGIAIFVLYFVQVGLGAAVHYIKPKSWVVERRRPLQNYTHAVIGLLIIALAFYQVRTGFRTEWPTTTGRPPVANAANIVWYVWVVLVFVLYFAGLALLRRQFRQERTPKPDPYTTSETDNLAMQNQGAYRDSPRDSIDPRR
ncbi:hypothetical protein K474DRAFT_1315198 [Panus rudis PR-1116 ss-1]|nr:hypothetical protein K474DRAFT_1315198 [Panus rudis PR-1116 ss-1]